MTCKFCEDYKELMEMLKEKQARRESKFVAVLREDIKKGGCVSYGSYDLNYCPSCGARLEEKKVRCIDCRHVSASRVGRPDECAICDSPIWDKLSTGPHMIYHDVFKPIRCDYFEKKEGDR